jgi:hypothetical protein
MRRTTLAAKPCPIGRKIGKISVIILIVSFDSGPATLFPS